MLRVLLIDDEESYHFAMREFLATRGHHAESARDRLEARLRMIGGGFDAVIADVRLTGPRDVDGLEIVAEIRRDHPALPILVVSACDLEFEAAARRAGADGFLQKPQPLSRISETIEALVRAGRPSPPDETGR